MQAMLICPVSSTQGVPGNHCTALVKNRGRPLSLGFLPGGGRRPPEQQSTNSDTPLILLVVLQFKRQK